MKLGTFLWITTIVAAKTLQLAQASDFIVGGDNVAAHQPIAQTTVALVIGRALCTGSILSEDLIVTAAHCLADQPKSIAIVFSTELSADAPQHAVMADKYLIHPNYREGLSTPDQNDLGMVHFKGGLPPGYAANSLLQDGREITQGRAAILAGYGITDAKTQKGAGKLRTTTVQIGDEHFGKSEVLLMQNHGHGACHGDSGGPAFLAESGRLKLWGVTSRSYPLDAPDDCAHESIYTNLLEQTEFLKLATQKLRSSS